MLNFIFIILAIFLLYYKYHLLAGILIGFVVGNFIGFNLALLDVEHGIIVMKEWSAFITFFGWMVLDDKKKNRKQFRHKEEYGSAKWGTDKDIEPFMDNVSWLNIPLTATEGLRLTRPPHPKYNRNKNMEIIGGSGSGKTRGFVKPSLMQMHTSYVVTDPKGTVLVEVGKMLRKGGYVFYDELSKQDELSINAHCQCRMCSLCVNSKSCP